jgi:hypothetical protein
MQEVVAPRVRVLFDDPALEAYAQRVANEAERALEVLLPFFDFQPPPLTLLLKDDGDVYNAFALALPRPTTVLPALFPSEVQLGYGAEDDLFLLLIHELTHNLHFAYTEGAPGLGLGFVGETVAALPPAWFIEGLAVWTESEFTRGGRRDDALTRGLRASAALGGTWPSLAAAGLTTYSDWPGGLTRYLYGVGFVDYLLGRYGLTSLRAALRRYNAASPLSLFADAWREAAGADLEADWAEWRERERQAAAARAAGAHAGARRTLTGWYTRAPALSPSGRQLAWVSPFEGVRVAALGEGEERLESSRLVLAERLPAALAWLDETTLLYSRTVRQPGGAASDLFALEVATGLETRLTHGTRARFPSLMEDGCVLFLRDAPVTGSALETLCQGERRELWQRREVWRVPPDRFVVGLAAGPDGRVALSVWERGGYLNLALLEGGELRFLTRDRAQDLEPRWHGSRLLFRSDRDPTGAFDLYALHPETGALTRLTRTVGGAFSPAPGPESLWYVELGAEGYDLAELSEPLEEEVVPLFEAPTAAERPSSLYPVRPYSPLASLAPYGWLPTDLGFGAAADGGLYPRAAVTVYGQDDSSRHAYTLTLGYDGGLRGHLGGAYAAWRYGYGEPGLVTAVTAEPLSFALQAGLWPHQAHLRPRLETALGVRAELGARLPRDDWTAHVGLGAGLLSLASRPGLQPDLRLGATLSRQRHDPWGYPSRGPGFGLSAVLSASDQGLSPGLWAEAHTALPLAPRLPGRLLLTARGGYRPPPTLPARPSSDWAAFAGLGFHQALPLAWRYGDGRYAAERLSLEPRLHLWFDGALRLGGELSLYLDTVLNYAAPVSVGATLGYSDGFWTRLGYRLPF